VSDSVTDFYHQKTDDELRFLVDHPEYYQPSLIAAAQRELRRRGATRPAVPDEGYAPAPPTRGATRPGGLLLTVAAGVALLLSVGDYFKQKNSPAAVAARAAVRKVPTLEEVPTTALPAFDGAVARCVQRQVQRIPAGERAAAARAAMPMHQYRELTKRFWAAETLTEYVTEQARQGQGKGNDAFAGHVEIVMASWEQWNKANVYSYKFGPAMATHLDLMSRVARQQQEGLADLLLVARNPQPYETPATRRRAADVSDLLSGLQTVSPVTGRPYNAVVRSIRL